MIGSATAGSWAGSLSGMSGLGISAVFDYHITFTAGIGEWDWTASGGPFDGLVTCPDGRNIRGAATYG